MSNLKKIFLFVVLTFGAFSFSQEGETVVDRGKATIDENYCLILDNTVAVQEYYAADASGLAWTSAAHAKKMCGFHSNNLVWYMPDYDNNQILIHICLDRTYEPRDIAWWNAYLKSICD